MEMVKFWSSQSVGVSCVGVLGLVGAIIVVHVAWWRPKRLEMHLRKQGLKGTSYRPFTGDMNLFGSTLAQAMSTPISLHHNILPRVMPFHHMITQKYGKMSMYWWGTKARVIVAEAETVRSLLMEKNGNTVHPPLSPLLKLLQQGIITLDGHKWAHRRKLIQPAFAVDKLKRMMPAFYTSCCDLVDRWDKVAGEVDVAAEFQNLTADVISRTAFGSSYREGMKIFELQRKLVVLLVEVSRSVYIPGFRFIPTRKNREMYALDKKIRGMLIDMIHKKEEAKRNGQVGDGDDFLGLLLKSEDEDDNGLTMEDVIEECKLFYFGGQETSASLLTWTIILLSLHQNWQQLARNEVFQVCGNKKPDFHSLSHLKIVSMILNEVLRMYPPIPLVWRYTEKKTNIEGRWIPRGVVLQLPVMVLHYDAEYWGEDVEEFKPERFGEGVSKEAFYPFGWGPKICLGQNFAMVEVKMALAMILQRFSFHLSPTYAHAPCHAFILKPQHGAPIILHKI